MFEWLFGDKKQSDRNVKSTGVEGFVEYLKDYFEIKYEVGQPQKKDINRIIKVPKGNNKLLTREDLLSILVKCGLRDYFELNIANIYQVSQDMFCLGGFFNEATANKILYLLNYTENTGDVISSDVFINKYLEKQCSTTYDARLSAIECYTEFLVGYIKKGGNISVSNTNFKRTHTRRSPFDTIILLPRSKYNIESALNECKYDKVKDHIYTYVEIFNINTLLDIGETFSVYGFTIPKGYICPNGFLESCEGQPFTVYDCNDYKVYGKQYVPLFKDIVLPKKGC